MVARGTDPRAHSFPLWTADLHGAKRRRDPVLSDLDGERMNRAELTEKILDIKREKGWTWKHVTDEIGGMSPILVVGALLGQMKLPKPLAEKAASLFGLSESRKADAERGPDARHADAADRPAHLPVL